MEEGGRWRRGEGGEGDVDAWAEMWDSSVVYRGLVRSWSRILNVYGA